MEKNRNFMGKDALVITISVSCLEMKFCKKKKIMRKFHKTFQVHLQPFEEDTEIELFCDEINKIIGTEKSNFSMIQGSCIAKARNKQRPETA